VEPTTHRVAGITMRPKVMYRDNRRTAILPPFETVDDLGESLGGRRPPIAILLRPLVVDQVERPRAQFEIERARDHFTSRRQIGVRQLTDEVPIVRRN